MTSVRFWFSLTKKAHAGLPGGSSQVYWMVPAMAWAAEESLLVISHMAVSDGDSCRARGGGKGLGGCPASVAHRDCVAHHAEIYIIPSRNK